MMVVVRPGQMVCAAPLATLPRWGEGGLARCVAGNLSFGTGPLVSKCHLFCGFIIYFEGTMNILRGRQ